MVILNKIYTRTGDKGETVLVGGLNFCNGALNVCFVSFEDVAFEIGFNGADNFLGGTNFFLNFEFWDEIEDDVDRILFFLIF